MIKSVKNEEHKMLRAALPQYYHHMTQPHTADTPSSLINRIVGCHVVRLSKHSKIGAIKKYLIVQTNVFNTRFRLKIHRRFDLKGSWVGRQSTDEELKKDGKTLKDLDFEKLG